MDSIVETARQAHEEVDLYEQALAAIFLQPDKTVRPPLFPRTSGLELELRPRATSAAQVADRAL